MARLDDHHVLSVVGVRAMSIRRHDPADLAMIEGKGAEVLGDQYDRVALALSEQKAREGMMRPRSIPSSRHRA
jgi:hypothetical protein